LEDATEGHVLFHIFDDYGGITISVDMSAFTMAPIRGRRIDILLTIMAIPENKYGLVSAELRERVHKECLTMALCIIRELRASQYSMLAFLSNLPSPLIAHIGVSKTPTSEELACITMGVINALSLPSDPRVAPIIPGIVSGILRVKEVSSRLSGRTKLPTRKQLSQSTG